MTSNADEASDTIVAKIFWILRFLRIGDRQITSIDSEVAVYVWDIVMYIHIRKDF